MNGRDKRRRRAAQASGRTDITRYLVVPKGVRVDLLSPGACPLCRKADGTHTMSCPTGRPTPQLEPDTKDGAR